ncbi:tyrosine-protein phosphatase, partial [Enterococcus sp. S181_ASV_20]|nr:tyrosine-protein phosphatase [Enterococcus sp. S181_ASV_20]
LDVNQTTITKDYLATNRYLKKAVEEMYQKAEKAGVPADSLNGIEDMMKAKKEYLQTSFKLIKEQYGTMNNFIRDGIGVTKQEIKDLKKIYLL